MLCFFFFFNWLYNPWWVLASLTTVLQASLSASCFACLSKIQEHCYFYVSSNLISLIIQWRFFEITPFSLGCLLHIFRLACGAGNVTVMMYGGRVRNVKEVVCILRCWETRHSPQRGRQQLKNMHQVWGSNSSDTENRCFLQCDTV
jgi:hypothetical protein